jgi:hypothetical protein
MSLMVYGDKGHFTVRTLVTSKILCQRRGDANR